MMSKGLLNIPSFVEDPNYRYKMPRPELKIEGRGNGIKTNLVNLSDIAKSLRVPPDCRSFFTFA
jgi:translation initiation factor 5